VENLILANKDNGFVRIASSHKEWPESSIFQFLSPVRLPFRHTGGSVGKR